MTGTVPRSFMVPTSRLPAATQRRKRSSSESRKFHSRKEAAELSSRSFSSRKSPSSTWRPSGPP